MKSYQFWAIIFILLSIVLILLSITDLIAGQSKIISTILLCGSFCAFAGLVIAIVGSISESKK